MIKPTEKLINLHDKWYIGDAKMGKKVTLRIEKKGFGFRLILGNETYFVRDKGKHFVLEVERDREAIDMVNELYENLGVKGMEDLICRLMMKPSETLYMLLGEKIRVGKVVLTLG